MHRIRSQRAHLRGMFKAALALFACAALVLGTRGAAVAGAATPRQTAPDTEQMLLNNPLSGAELPSGDVASLPFESDVSPAFSAAVTAVRTVVVAPAPSASTQYIDDYVYASPDAATGALAQAQTLTSDPSVTGSGAAAGFSAPAFWVTTIYGSVTPGGQSDCVTQVDNLLVDAVVITFGDAPADNSAAACALAQADVAHLQLLEGSASASAPSGPASAPPANPPASSLPACIGSQVSPGQTFACAAPAGQWTRHVSMSWRDNACPGAISVTFYWGDTDASGSPSSTTVTSNGPCNGMATATHVYSTSDGDTATYTVTTSDANLPNPFLTMTMTFEASVSSATAADISIPFSLLWEVP